MEIHAERINGGNALEAAQEGGKKILGWKIARPGEGVSALLGRVVRPAIVKANITVIGGNCGWPNERTNERTDKEELTKGTTRWRHLFAAS